MAYSRFFRNDVVKQTPYFAERPRTIDLQVMSLSGSYVNTGGLDTSAIDGYRQGVELTQQKHYDAGTVKIYAGYPGHTLPQSRYGEGSNLKTIDNTYQDKDYFDPQVFLEAQYNEYVDLGNVLTFPIITGDNDQADNYVFDGIIEPFQIREVVSFFSIEMPRPSHTVRGTIMGGNEDSLGGADAVVSISRKSMNEQVPYIDSIDMFGSASLPGFFNQESSILEPFDDIRLPGNVVPSASYGNDMIAALSMMSGSTDNYVSSNQQGHATGWQYTNTPIGVDSIAFGGQLY